MLRETPRVAPRGCVRPGSEDAGGGRRSLVPLGRRPSDQPRSAPGVGPRPVPAQTTHRSVCPACLRQVQARARLPHAAGASRAPRVCPGLGLDTAGAGAHGCDILVHLHSAPVSRARPPGPSHSRHGASGLGGTHAVRPPQSRVAGAAGAQAAAWMPARAVSGSPHAVPVAAE